jgi:lysophospholipase L1-like esterase
MRIFLVLVLALIASCSEPNTEKTVVIFGSSVARGVGATNDHGWADMLGEKLEARGYTYHNISVPGDTTQALINRFQSDLVPLNPQIVVIGLSLANEGFVGAEEKSAIAAQFVQRMEFLVEQCKERGYTPIVAGVYSNNAYTKEDLGYLMSVEQRLSTMGVPYISFLAAVDDGTGRWKPGLFADGGHPNDAGHLAMFNAVPMTVFDSP